MADFARTLGARLAALRSRAGHSQESFADAIGVCRNTITGWECGRFQPSLDRVPRICEALFVSPDDLFGYQDDEPGITERRERAAAARLIREAPLAFVKIARDVLALAQGRADD